MKKQEKDSSRPDSSFTMGAIALVFLAIAYQTALFIQRAAVARIEGNSDRPDTVYVYAVPEEGTSPAAPGEASPAVKDGAKALTRRKNAAHSPVAAAVRERHLASEKPVYFSFDPNTVSTEDLVRLGFSPGQAAAIDRYRTAGGRFRRKSDFARPYAVSDSMYSRLEPYICFSRTDINAADSSEFDSLPGIGPHFASRMVSYRKKLGGYSSVEQLLEIPGFDTVRLGRIRDMVTVAVPFVLDIWSMPEDSLSAHPYFDRNSAHSVVLFRENNPREEWSVDNLLEAGAIGLRAARKIRECTAE